MKQKIKRIGMQILYFGLYSFPMFIIPLFILFNYGFDTMFPLFLCFIALLQVISTLMFINVTSDFTDGSDLILYNDTFLILLLILSIIVKPEPLQLIIAIMIIGISYPINIIIANLFNFKDNKLFFPYK